MFYSIIIFVVVCLVCQSINIYITQLNSHSQNWELNWTTEPLLLQNISVSFDTVWRSMCWIHGTVLVKSWPYHFSHIANSDKETEFIPCGQCWPWGGANLSGQVAPGGQLGWLVAGRLELARVETRGAAGGHARKGHGGLREPWGRTAGRGADHH